MQIRTRFSQFGRLLAAILALSVASAGTDARAQAPSGAGTPSSPVNVLNPLTWNWPQWKAPELKMPRWRSVLPSRNDKDRIVKKKDSLFDDVAGTAQKSWAKTKEVLHPRNLNPMNLFRGDDSPRGSRSPGFFGSLFQPQEPPDRVAGVTEYLSRPRPGR